MDALEAAGVGAAGTARTVEEAAEPVIYDVEGVAIAHLSATYGLNNVPMPLDQPWLVDLTDVEAIIADAATAREAGAEFVLVSLHHGVEYQIEPSDAQRSRADALLASDAIDAKGREPRRVRWHGRTGDTPLDHGGCALMSS